MKRHCSSTIATALLLLVVSSTGIAQARQQADVAADTRPRLVVAGFARDIDLEAWRDARVGMGLVAVLADTLYSSGMFRLLDEKEDVRAELRSLAARLWASSQNDTATVAAEVASSVAVLNPDVVASGRILRFEAPGSRMSFGPLQRAQRSFVVEVEVSLKDTHTGRVQTARESAEASRVAVSAIFSVQNDKVLFDNTAVGKATNEALVKAVAKLLIAYRSSNDPGRL